MLRNLLNKTLFFIFAVQPVLASECVIPSQVGANDDVVKVMTSCDQRLSRSEGLLRKIKGIIKSLPSSEEIESEINSRLEPFRLILVRAENLELEYSKFKVEEPAYPMLSRYRELESIHVKLVADADVFLPKWDTSFLLVEKFPALKKLNDVRARKLPPELLDLVNVYLSKYPIYTYTKDEVPRGLVDKINRALLSLTIYREILNNRIDKFFEGRLAEKIGQSIEPYIQRATAEQYKAKFFREFKISETYREATFQWLAGMTYRPQKDLESKILRLKTGASNLPASLRPYLENDFQTEVEKFEALLSRVKNSKLVVRQGRLIQVIKSYIENLEQRTCKKPSDFESKLLNLKSDFEILSNSELKTQKLVAMQIEHVFMQVRGMKESCK